MKNPLSYYTMLAKRWAWMVALGIVICGCTSYGASKLIHPVYQASANVFVNYASATSAYDNISASLEAVQTYAQLLKSPEVLEPVLAQHRGLTLQQLDVMITVTPQPNTQLIEVDVVNRDPGLAMQLANEICESFAQFSNAQLPISVQVLPATLPITPVRPQPLLYAGIGALVGLGLAVALIFIFEWVDGRLVSPEEAEELLSSEILSIIPRFSRKERNQNAKEIPTLAESQRILCASLNIIQAIKPFKLVMVTSALAGEGKSTIASNLASFMAMAGKRVLLVDADLRYPVLDQHFELTNYNGLSNAFLGMWEHIDVELNGQPTEIPFLRVLTAGLLPPQPAELLQSPSAKRLFDRLKKTQAFDYVIVDTPPLLPVADAQILASYVEAIVLVIDASKTPRKVLLHARQLLSRARASILGVVINKSDWSDYSDIRQYLRTVVQQQPATSNIPMMISPNTPPAMDLIDQDIGNLLSINDIVDSDTTPLLSQQRATTDE